MNIRHTIEEVRLLGPSRTVYRIWYEITRRAGMRDAAKKIPETSPDFDMTFEKWKESGVKPFLKGLDESSETYLKYFSINKEAIIEEADRALEGKIRFFSKWEVDLGKPFNWHHSPFRKNSWPADVSSNSVSRYEAECGDIKMPWEPSRFPHMYKVCRAYMLTGDDKYARFFVDQVYSWAKANEPMKGVNWYNGQEGAIRILAWIFALYVFKDSKELDEKFFQFFLDQLYKHTVFIDSNIDYAKHAVTNNHLIGEALGVYIPCVLFPFIPGFDKLKKRAAGVLFGKACKNQFYPDGGYCQLSFSYQRLALSYYLWCFQTAESNGESVPYKWMKDIFSRSLELLTGCMNMADGRLPNWGANDGAMLAPWTEADFNDYRPLASALSYVVSGTKILEGNSDEELFWLFGADALSAEKAESPTVTYFPYTGIKVLRQSPVDLVFFRCGTPPDRFGQSDQNSVVIFINGEEIAIDGGSYMYNDELEFHRYFMGTKSHNTLTVDGHDQMLLYRRFKWLYPSKGEITEENESYVCGCQHGYERLYKGAFHERSINSIGGEISVVDTLGATTSAKTVSLHWHIPGFKYEQTETDAGVRFIFTTDSGQVIQMDVSSQSSFAVSAVKGSQKTEEVRGWYSRYYGEKRECLDLRFDVVSQETAVFKTVFSKV